MSDPFAIADRINWKQDHRSYLGGSSISAAAGLNRYKTRLQLYLSLKGEIEDNAGVKARMGTCLEPLLREMFWEETGLMVIPAPMMLHPEYDFLGANPDGGIQDEEESMFEGKTFDFSTEESWGEPGTDQIPPEHFMQTQFYMGMWGKRKCYVAALHRTTGKFSVYVVRYDPEVYELLVEAGVKFWREHIEANVPPEAEAGDADYLRDKYPTDTGEAIDADEQAELWAAYLLDARAQYEPLVKRHDDMKAKLMGFMGEASLLRTANSGDFTWRKAKDKLTTDYAAAFAMREANPDMPRAEIIAACTTAKPGNRTFNVPKGTK